MGSLRDHWDEPKTLRKLFILGAGAHGKVISQLIRGYITLQAGGFTDPSEDLNLVNGFKVHGSDRKVIEDPINRGSTYILGMGWEFLSIRRELAEFADNHGWEPNKAIVHPSAIVDPSVEIGKGTVVFPGATINPFTKIGEHCVINTGAIIEHDNVIGSNTFIAPGVVTGGTTKIGSNAVVGIGTRIRDRVEIADNTFIKAGSLIIKFTDTPVYRGK